MVANKTRSFFILVVIMLHYQRVCIHQYLVTMGAAEWPFIMTRGFILGVIIAFSNRMLNSVSQRVCIHEYLVTMGAAEWPLIMTRGFILGVYYSFWQPK